ncbi:MAG: Flp pilus assembly protein CpaB [Chloroflexota bacterium]
MGRRRGGIVLIVFGVLLAAVVGGAVFLMAQRTAEPAKAEDTTQVVVVLSDIGERSVISAASIGMAEVPTRLVPVTALRRTDDAVGNMALAAMYPGDYVLSDRIAKTNGESGFAFMLDEGQVLMTFPMSDIVSGGAVRQGDTVDLLITLDPTKEDPTAPSAITQLTMQDLKVVSVGTGQAQNQANQGTATTSTAARISGQVVVFAVPRQDALVLKHLKDSDAKIEMALRAAGDTQVYTTEAVVMQSLIDRFNIQAP